MTAWLVTNPPRRSQYRVGRRATPTGAIAVHTSEWRPDPYGNDTAAEATARFIQVRSDPGSYHDLVDSDSIIHLVDYENEAYHDGTGGNRWSIGISAATQAARWNSMPQWWIDKIITNLAQAAANANTWLLANGYPGCPPRLINASQYRNGEAGFISHAAIDPYRRTDPGADFPWGQFLSEYLRIITGVRPPTEKDIMTLSDIVNYVQLCYQVSPQDVAGQVYWTDIVYDLVNAGDEEQALLTLRYMRDLLGLNSDA